MGVKRRASRCDSGGDDGRVLRRSYHATSNTQTWQRGGRCNHLARERPDRRDRLLLRDIEKVLAASYPGQRGASHAQAVATPEQTQGVTNPVGGSEPSPVSLTVIAMALALVAGFVDAVGFLHVVNVFPANQSGNVAFLGLSIGGASPAAGWGPPVASPRSAAGLRCG